MFPCYTIEVTSSTLMRCRTSDSFDSFGIMDYVTNQTLPVFAYLRVYLDADRSLCSNCTFMYLESQTPIFSSLTPLGGSCLELTLLGDKFLMNRKGEMINYGEKWIPEKV